MTADDSTRRRVSTGALPDRATVATLVAAAHRTGLADGSGTVSQVYPALARADAGAFGLALASTRGELVTAGQCDHRFTLMSVSKPFVLALVLDRVGLDRVRGLVGLNATGQAFNAAGPIDAGDGRTNPMVNAGAIATTSLAPGATLDEQWHFLAAGLSAFAGRELTLDEEVIGSVRATNLRNRALGWLLGSRGALAVDPDRAVELYSLQCCLAVDAADLAVMGATLADGGVQPVTGARVVSAEAARVALAVMAVAGLYETSGDWLVDVGVPGKSGISGGLVAVSPGKGAIGSYSAPLDDAGNSVRGQVAARFLAGALGLDLFGSAPSV